MRRRQLKRLWERLHELKGMELTRDQLLLKLGAAQHQSPSAWRLVKIGIPEGGEPWQFSLCKDKLRKVRRREGRYLLRTNLVGREPAQVWEFYTQLVQVEEAFKRKDLKSPDPPLFDKYQLRQMKQCERKLVHGSKAVFLEPCRAGHQHPALA